MAFLVLFVTTQELIENLYFSAHAEFLIEALGFHLSFEMSSSFDWTPVLQSPDAFLSGHDIKNDMTPGTYIRIYRENKNLTQKQLGELVGVSKAYICDIEKNRRSVSKELAKHFAEIFSVPVSKFI